MLSGDLGKKGPAYVPCSYTPKDTPEVQLREDTGVLGV